MTVILLGRQSGWVDCWPEAILKLEGDAGAALGELLVVAVPLHAAKRKQRGFNHAELLAKAAVRVLRVRRPEWKLTMEGRRTLERRKATLSQAGLSPAPTRRANLRGVFPMPRPEQIAGRDVLLIDDIYTTGATARACSQVLRRAGAASVRIATVARPQRDNAASPEFEQEEVPMEQDVAFWGAREQALSLPTTAANHESAGRERATHHDRGSGDKCL